MPALLMRDVRFKYSGSPDYALDSVSLEVEKGEFVTMLGANGSGKSTICLLANGLIPHSVPGTLEGRVEVFGEDTSKCTVSGLSTRVGIVFQEPESQLFCMSVEEEVAFGPENLGIPRHEIRDRVEWALEIVGMKGCNDRSPFSLSGGQKQRVAIAAALSMHPEMLVLDEPAYALDPVGRIGLYSVLRELKSKHGMTVLLAERDAEEAAAFSDRIAVMSKGKMIEIASPRRALRDPAKLRNMGIQPPQVSEVATLLNKRLSTTKYSFLTVEEAESTISQEIIGGGGSSSR